MDQVLTLFIKRATSSLSVFLWLSTFAFLSLLFFSLDEEPVEGALSQALPKFVQMGFIVPDVTKTLEEERVEEAQKMGKSKRPKDSRML